MRALLLLSLVLLAACGRGDDPPVAQAQAQTATPAIPTAADQLATLRELTKGHVYRGSTYAERIPYKRETVKGVEFEPSKVWLGLRVDDVDETAPVTVIVPLREVAVAIGAASQATPPGSVIRFSCNASSSCITTTAESFAQAVQKLTAGQGGALKYSDRRSTFQFGCPADKCVAIKQAIDQLASLPAAPRTSAAPGGAALPQPQSRQASPQAPTLAEILAQINALSGQIDYVAPDGTRVISYRYVTTLDRQRMQLIVTRDTQSFVATNPGASRITVRTTIPLAHVAVASFPDRVHKPKHWSFDVHEVGFACHERKNCVHAAAGGARGEYQGYGYECDASKCPALKQALGQLIAASNVPGASNAPATSNTQSRPAVRR